jgi:signal transduction histidine kinase
MVTVLSDVTREKELDEMKANFVNLVTHELRTPMVAIQKSVELILSQTTGPINDDQQRFLSISKNNLDRLNRLINDLLDMARLDAGRVSVRPVSFDLRDVIKDVCSTLASWAGDKQIPILFEPGTEPVTVFADRDRITQVLVNLLGNALKFTPVKGEVRVLMKSLDSKEGLCPEPCVEVAVTDTGIGVDPKDVERIFNKFEQASLVAPAGATGTGLGLPIAKEIVQLHHGSMWVESEKGKGSRFIFVIPKQFKDAN